MTSLMQRLSLFVAAVVMAAGLGACRQEEQNRPLTYEKGVYSGPKGTELSTEQQQQLRSRHRNQAGGGL